jgi:branched-chain amino acid transport system permease protein
MILFALTWDTMGGQMGYNSLGNILFFGAGMYISAVLQIGLYYDVAAYTAHFGAIKIDFTPTQYFTGLAAGVIAGTMWAAAAASPCRSIRASPTTAPCSSTSFASWLRSPLSDS